MLNKDLILLAAGGHGRVVLDAALAQGLSVEGILDPALPSGHPVFGVPVVGADEWLNQRDPGHTLLINGVGLVPGSDIRRRLFERWTSQGFGFVSVIHPSAVVAREVIRHDGVQIMAGAVVQTGSRLGVNVVINTRSSLDHDCHIDDHAFIAPGVVLCGGVKIGAGAFVGAHATVLPGVCVGASAIVGAGAVVTRNVPDHTVVLGHRATIRQP